jgi:hypothetical protein
MVVSAGCFNFKVEEEYGALGPAPSQKTLAKVERGVTTEQWVRQTLGEPSRESETEEGAKLLIYEYEWEKESKSHIILFTSNEEKRLQKRLVFEVKDGIVTDWWVEK